MASLPLPRSTLSVLVLGSTSLVGSHFVGSRAGQGIVAAGRRDPRDHGLRVERYLSADLSALGEIEEVLKKCDGASVVNFAARTDVDGCEKERPLTRESLLPEPERRNAWRINAELPGHLARMCAERGVYLIHISTDFVFNGESGPYAETALPDPYGAKVSWYGYTKGQGERAVLSLAPKDSAILRISYPYRAKFAFKTDFARSMLDRARERTLYPLYIDQMFTPTWIPDVTRVVEALLRTRATGVFHVASPHPTTPVAFGLALLSQARLPTHDLKTTRLSDVRDPERAPRPLRGGLLVDRVRALGVEPLVFEEGIRRLLNGVE